MPPDSSLPAGLRRTLTWDRGTELADHHQISGATGIEIYFADPHSPWQRGSKENTNGLLRQYFPKGSNLAVYTPEDLRRVQDELNGRPRKRYDWVTPTARLAALQCFHEYAAVATFAGFQVVILSGASHSAARSRTCPLMPGVWTPNERAAAASVTRPTSGSRAIRAAR